MRGVRGAVRGVRGVRGVPHHPARRASLAPSPAVLRAASAAAACCYRAGSMYAVSRLPARDAAATSRPARRDTVTSLNCARRTARRAAPARCAACSATARRRNSKVRHAHTILPHTFVCAGSPRVLRCCSDGRRPCVFRTVSGTHRPGRRQRAGSTDAFYAGAAYLRRMCQRRRAPGAR